MFIQARAIEDTVSKKNGGFVEDDNNYEAVVGYTYLLFRFGSPGVNALMYF